MGKNDPGLLFSFLDFFLSFPSLFCSFPFYDLNLVGY
jgi:hypothetical protein